MTRHLALMLLLVGGLSACGGGGEGAAADDVAMAEPAMEEAAADQVPSYALDPSWPPDLPNDWVMGVPTSVSVDSRDHVWVLHRPRTVPEGQEENAAPAVLEFDDAGAFVQAWGGPATDMTGRTPSTGSSSTIGTTFGSPESTRGRGATSPTGRTTWCSSSPRMEPSCSRWAGMT